MAVQSNNQVVIIQKTVPHYRDALFAGIANSLKMPVTVFCGWKAVGHVSTSVEQSKLYRMTLQSVSLLGNTISIQKGVLRVVRGMKTGDLLVVQGDPRIISNLLVMTVARRKGIRVIWWGHGFTSGSSDKVWIRQLYMRLADAVLLYTDREVERYKTGGFKGPALYALNNSIDQAVSADAQQTWGPERLKAFQTDHGLNPKRTLVCIGRLEPKMKLDFLLRALARGSRDLDLLVVGAGSEEETWKSLAKSLEISDRIRWLGALYKEDDLAPWLMSASAFVYPGSVGLSILHAFGYGLPAVTHDNELEHMPEFCALKHGRNGNHFCFEDQDSLLQVIESTLADYDNLSAGARQTVLEDWTIQNSIVRFCTAAAKTLASLR